MTNPLKGEAVLIVGETTYGLVIDQNALCSAEEMSGLDLDQLLDGLQRARSLRVRRALLWASLQAKHPGIHLIQAGEIMGAAAPGAVHDAISRAVIGAFPSAKPAGDQAAEEGGLGDPQ